MLLFQKRFHAGLVGGTVTFTFRQWERPHVRPGGLYRVHPIGVVRVDAVDAVRVGEITEAEALAAGFSSLAEMLEYMRPAAKGAFGDDTSVWRIRLRHAGEADHVPAALDAKLGPEEIDELARRLERLDRRGAWTRRTLELIRRHPRVAASKLAAKVGRETAPFKVDVRKLKRLGLTQSFEVGYALTPRGRAFLRRANARSLSRGPLRRRRGR